MNDRYRVELWQGDLMVAAVDCASLADAQREAGHYAIQYLQDGPVDIRFERIEERP